MNKILPQIRLHKLMGADFIYFANTKMEFIFNLVFEFV